MNGLQKYRCHKEVWAMKIKDVIVSQMPRFAGPTCRGCYAFPSACRHCERCRWESSGNTAGGAMLIPFLDADMAPVHVSREYVDKHKPEPNGYYVLYDDGYASFSPGKAFEDGYAKV
jgi:hypothetical protein